MTIDEVKEAIDAYFSNTSVSKDETIEGLLDIECHAQNLRETLWEEREAERNDPFGDADNLLFGGDANDD